MLRADDVVPFEEVPTTHNRAGGGDGAGGGIIWAKPGAKVAVAPRSGGGATFVTTNKTLRGDSGHLCSTAAVVICLLTCLSG